MEELAARDSTCSVQDEKERNEGSCICVLVVDGGFNPM